MLEGVLLDIDGVLLTSWRPIEGAREAFAGLREEGIAIRLVTNSTTLSRRRLATTLRNAGFPVDQEDLVTAPRATAAYLRSHHSGARCFLIANKEVVGDFEGIELVEKDADVIVIGGTDVGARPEDVFTYENLNHVFRMLASGATLIAMHRNLAWMTDEGLTLDAGAFIRGLEEAAGVKAKVVGKPSADFFRGALELMGLPAEKVAMVGDDVENDVLAAQSLGITGVLIRTGRFRPQELQRASGKPDHIIDWLPDLLGIVRPTEG